MYLFLCFSISAFCVNVIYSNGTYNTEGLNQRKNAETIKLKLHCSNVRIYTIDSSHQPKTNDRDILTIYIYDDLHSVNVISEKFGFKLEFRGNWKYYTREDNKGLSGGGYVTCVDESYVIDRYNNFIMYSRPKEKGGVQPFIAFCQGNKHYEFDIRYGEVYDAENGRWIFGDVQLPSQWEDKVRRLLRNHIAMKFCTNFEESLEDRISVYNDDDPWDK